MSLRMWCFFFPLYYLWILWFCVCMNEMHFFSFYLVLLSVGCVNVVIVPLRPCCLNCHFCMFWLCMLAVIIIPAFIYSKWCYPGSSAFILTCCFLVLLFVCLVGVFFVVLVFISFWFGLFFCFCLANKVELTKADLQGREGCSSPLLVSMKDAFM